MRKSVQRIGRKPAFTLVELMVVVTIIAILALVAIPLYSANTTAAIMAEGSPAQARSATPCGSTRPSTALTPGPRFRAAARWAPCRSAPPTCRASTFAQADYSLLSVSSSTYTIKAGPPSLTSHTGMPYYEINQLGSELGTYYSGQ